MVRMILCCDYEGNIGRNNDLLFKIKEDMQFFKSQTTGHVVIMGYNTWLSLGEKPLPNRTNIVLYDEDIEGVIVSNDIKKVIEEYKDEDIYIIGGAFVYNQALEMDIVDEILITVVSTIVKDADTKVNLELMKEFYDEIIIKSFMSKEGFDVFIERRRKINWEQDNEVE